jgi:hypothetical protein
MSTVGTRTAFLWSPNGTNNILAQDDFQRPNENPLSQGGKWSASSGGISGGVELFNQQVCAGAGGTSFYSGVSFPNDQWMSFTITNITTQAYSTNYLRASANLTTYYYVSPEIGAVDYGLNNNGSQSNNAFITTVSSGDSFLATMQGTILTIYQNGSRIVTFSDATVASGMVGVSAVSGIQPVTTGALINFRAGSVPATGSLVVSGSIVWDAQYFQVVSATAGWFCLPKGNWVTSGYSSLVEPQVSVDTTPVQFTDSLLQAIAWGERNPAGLHPTFH